MAGVGRRQAFFGGERFGLGRRRAERAETVENPQRRQKSFRRRARRGFGDDAGAIDDPLEHFDEQAGQRQVRPARVRRDMEQDQASRPALLGGDQRRAIGEPRPGLGGQALVRLGQDLARHRDFGRRRQAEERAGFVERSQRLGPVPRTGRRRACGRRAAAVTGNRSSSRARPGAARRSAEACRPTAETRRAFSATPARRRRRRRGSARPRRSSSNGRSDRRRRAWPRADRRRATARRADNGAATEAAAGRAAPRPGRRAAAAQPASSSSIAPAECSPRISSRAISLRSWTGRSKRALARQSRRRNRNRLSPSEAPLAS